MFIFVFPRGRCPLRGIPYDLITLRLSNLVIVEPVVLISPFPTPQQKTDHSVGSCSGGSGWIRTTSVIRQQIYSLPRLSNSGARPIYWKNKRKNHLLFTLFLVRAAGIEPAFQAWKACILAFVLCSQQIQSPMIIY